jgi:hypothetical protein
MLTHTEIPYWLSLSWVQTCAWATSVKRVQDEDAPREPS